MIGREHRCPEHWREGPSLVARLLRCRNPNQTWRNCQYRVRFGPRIGRTPRRMATGRRTAPQGKTFIGMPVLASPGMRSRPMPHDPALGRAILAPRVASIPVAGVDQSQEMVRQAAARNASSLRNAKVDLRHGSIERLPFADETFDKVFAINSMQVWQDVRGLAGDTARPQIWWLCCTLLHCQFWSVTGQSCGVSYHRWICTGANCRPGKPILHNRGKAVS